MRDTMSRSGVPFEVRRPLLDHGVVVNGGR
jgi:hypothetical protein